MEEIDDYEYDEHKHDRLINAISKLDKTQHIKQPSRNEATNQTSEFNLIKSSRKLDIGNIFKGLESTSNHVKIGKKLKKSQEITKVLSKPLEKPQAERIKRATGYEQAKVKLGRWDPVVARSRSTDYVSFPLRHTKNKMASSSEFLSKLTLKSQLELELDEVDPPPVEEMEDDEDEKVFPMSYEEMVEHRQHLAKIRAQQSFKAAKAKRQSKIKSKKYHRILKKEKLKQQIKEFEELQKTDPEEALKKLEALEKSRVLERHTLRHKNTGKWAKNLMVRAKYDKDVRQELAEQLAVSRALTKKTQVDDSSDDEPETNEVIPDLSLLQDPNNPWLLKSSDKSNVDAEFDFGYKKYLKNKMYKKKNDSDSEIEEDDEKVVTEEIHNEGNNAINTKTLEVNDLHEEKVVKLPRKESKKKKSEVSATTNWNVQSISEDISNVFDTLESKMSDQVEKKLRGLRRNLEALEKISARNNTKKRKVNHKDVDNLEYLKMGSKKRKSVIDEELHETSSKTPEDLPVKNTPLLDVPQVVEGTDQNSTVANIDPSKFIEAKPKYLNTALSASNEYDEIDDEEQVVPKVNIEEVFEQDDVVASFRQEKEDEANKDNTADIDLSLPGWGSWGGKGVKAPKRKRNRFILKAPPVMPRRDENKGDIIIKEYRDPKLASHKVSDVPFPFSSVREYEASIRAPLGNTFIPEKAHKKLIKPDVITKAGAIIEPMDEEQLLLPKNKSIKNDKVIKILGKK